MRLLIKSIKRVLGLPAVIKILRSDSDTTKVATSSFLVVFIVALLVMLRTTSSVPPVIYLIAGVPLGAAIDRFYRLRSRQVLVS